MSIKIAYPGAHLHLSSIFLKAALNRQFDILYEYVALSQYLNHLEYMGFICLTLEHTCILQEFFQKTVWHLVSSPITIQKGFVSIFETNCTLNICNSRSKALFLSSRQVELNQVKFFRGESNNIGLKPNKNRVRVWSSNWSSNELQHFELEF